MLQSEKFTEFCLHAIGTKFSPTQVLIHNATGTHATYLLERVSTTTTTTDRLLVAYQRACELSYGVLSTVTDIGGMSFDQLVSGDNNWSVAPVIRPPKRKVGASNDDVEEPKKRQHDQKYNLVSMAKMKSKIDMLLPVPDPVILWGVVEQIVGDHFNPYKHAPLLPYGMTPYEWLAVNIRGGFEEMLVGAQNSRKYILGLDGEPQGYVVKVTSVFLDDPTRDRPVQDHCAAFTVALFMNVFGHLSANQLLPKPLFGGTSPSIGALIIWQNTILPSLYIDTLLAVTGNANSAVLRQFTSADTAAENLVVNDGVFDIPVAYTHPHSKRVIRLAGVYARSTNLVNAPPLRNYYQSKEIQAALLIGDYHVEWNALIVLAQEGLVDKAEVLRCFVGGAKITDIRPDGVLVDLREAKKVADRLLLDATYNVKNGYETINTDVNGRRLVFRRDKFQSVPEGGLWPLSKLNSPASLYLIHSMTAGGVMKVDASIADLLGTIAGKECLGTLLPDVNRIRKEDFELYSLLENSFVGVWQDYNVTSAASMVELVIGCLQCYGNYRTPITTDVPFSITTNHLVAVTKTNMSVWAISNLQRKRVVERVLNETGPLPEDLLALTDGPLIAYILHRAMTTRSPEGKKHLITFACDHFYDLAFKVYQMKIINCDAILVYDEVGQEAMEKMVTKTLLERAEPHPTNLDVLVKLSDLLTSPVILSDNCRLFCSKGPSLYIANGPDATAILRDELYNISLANTLMGFVFAPIESPLLFNGPNTAPVTLTLVYAASVPDLKHPARVYGKVLTESIGEPFLKKMIDEWISKAPNIPFGQVVAHHALACRQYGGNNRRYLDLVKGTVLSDHFHTSLLAFSDATKRYATLCMTPSSFVQLFATRK